MADAEGAAVLKGAVEQGAAEVEALREGQGSVGAPEILRERLGVKELLQRKRACGFGVCVGCVVGTRGTASAPIAYRRICTDGPLFDAAQVCW